VTSLGAPVVRAISAVREPGTAADPRVAGFTRVDGRLANFGVPGIVPSPGSTLRPRPGPLSLIIMIQYVDETLLEELAHSYRLSGLTLASDPPPDIASLPLTLTAARSPAFSPGRPTGPARPRASSCCPG
jgi:hypothetical protein